MDGHKLNKKQRKKVEQSIKRNLIAKKEYKRLAQRERTLFAAYYIVRELGKKPFILEDEDAATE